MRRAVSIILTLGLTLSCGQEKSSGGDGAQTGTQASYRYIDRETYLPIGSSVSPQMGSALEVVRQALSELELATDLGAGYFNLKTAENSLLQPPLTATSYVGRNWLSFYQVFEDGPLNEAMNSFPNAPVDQDMIAALNASNPRQWYVVMRLSCFTSGATCGFPSTNQAKLMVWRSMGYLIGLRNGQNAASAIMKPGLVPEDAIATEKRKFVAEFNGALENMRNGVTKP